MSAAPVVDLSVAGARAARAPQLGGNVRSALAERERPTVRRRAPVAG